MKPECTHCRERFSDYLDGLLAAPERQELDAHLAGCAECRRELDLWRATVQAVGELPRRGAPQGFGARVMEGLEAQGAQAPARPRVRSLWLRAMAVAAMLLVVLGVVLIVQRSGAPTPSPSTAPVRLAERLGVPEAPATVRRPPPCPRPPQRPPPLQRPLPLQRRLPFLLRCRSVPPAVRLSAVPAPVRGRDAAAGGAACHAQAGAGPTQTGQ